MRTLCLVLTLAVLSALSANAQTEPPIVPGAQPLGPGSQKPLGQYHVEDGGARGGVLESIAIPPKLKAPFSLVLETEWVRGLADGGPITTVNKRRIARDAQGRIFQERHTLVPKDGKQESQTTTIQISDPSTHTLYNCFLMGDKHECIVITYVPPPDTVF